MIESRPLLESWNMFQSCPQTHLVPRDTECIVPAVENKTVCSCCGQSDVTSHYQRSTIICVHSKKVLPSQADYHRLHSPTNSPHSAPGLDG